MSDIRSNPVEETESLRESAGVTRRATIKGAAWSIPAVAVAASAPLAVASEVVTGNYTWYWSQFQVGGGGNRVVQAVTRVSIQKVDGNLDSVPFLGAITIQFRAYADAAKSILVSEETKDFFFQYDGASGDTSTELLWERQLSAAQWPPHGGQLWVEFDLVSMTGAPGGGSPMFTLSRNESISGPNPYTGVGYVGSW